MCRVTTLAVAFLLGLGWLAASTSKPLEPTPAVRIDLTALGYSEPTSAHSNNKTVFRDLTLLMQDEDRRLSFVGPNTLALYFNRPPERSKDGNALRYSMEVFFLNTETGKLVERRTWDTFKRQWFDDAYDTEARIMEVRSGFLVEAGAKLELHAPDLRLVRSYDLLLNAPGKTGMWSVKVAPGGDTIYVQPSEQTTQVRYGAVSYFTGRGESEGTWFRTDSFEKIGSQTYLSGPDSVSHGAIVTSRSHCLDLQRVGEAPHHISCSTAPAGLPMFLNDDEILSVNNTSFSMLSTDGTKLWTAGVQDPGVHRSFEIDSYKRSMDGSRFAISLTAYKKKAEFDGIPLVRSPLHTIVVYDTRCRQHLFSLTTGPPGAFALSPEGQSLAILTKTIVSIYSLKGATCGPRLPS